MIKNECELDDYELPIECINEICTMGSNDAAVYFWLDELKFKVDITFAKEFLDNYGLEEMQSRDERSLSAYVLWCEAWNRKERKSC